MHRIALIVVAVMLAGCIVYGERPADSSPPPSPPAPVATNAPAPTAAEAPAGTVSPAPPPATATTPSSPPRLKPAPRR